MSINTSLDAVALLAQLATADPYTALEPTKVLSTEHGYAAAPTAASTAKPSAFDNQVAQTAQLSPQQSTASALHLLQQLLDSPSNSSSMSEVNSKATGVIPAQNLTRTLREAGQHADTASSVSKPAPQLQKTANKSSAAAAAARKPSSTQIRAYRAGAGLDPGMRPDTGSCKSDCRRDNISTAASSTNCNRATAAEILEEEASDWTIIEDFCSRTVPRTWLRLVLHGWHAVYRSRVKWRCIQQVRLPRSFPRFARSKFEKLVFPAHAQLCSPSTSGSEITSSDSKPACAARAVVHLACLGAVPIWLDQGHAKACLHEKGSS